ncbi:Na+/H+ antiporter NhaD-like permease [Desulfosporosinus acidiphilus SJ4]|uniref:Na+/H+ antiporter NhaD-like permease n=1 Tax=Desulfosporosinus acidiphilus (strain DSM 22704 / JCM 16185 / SJ4) TaxID=646529 RepID=I4D4D8_DESAJ|nr:anion transporter [Desulfosporosinus acidiphilus]AFM40662.1 Na+/H+ antiporter NhaD-like permease [Desulfosporosinus acidiphilus SJ4]
MIISGLILTLSMLVFAIGKSPVFRVDRAGIAIIGAALTVGTGVMSFDQAAQAVDYRTIILLFSMMIITSYLNMSGFFQLAGNQFLSRLNGKNQLLFMVILITGILSAFFINDIVCLLLTPIVIMITRRARLNPTPYLLGVAAASNIGSAATLIGNPQNILIESLSRINFGWYMALAIPISLVGLVLIYVLLSWIYKEELSGQLPEFQPMTGVVHGYLVKKGLVVVFLVLVGFLMGFDPAIVASLGAAYLLITRRVKPNKIYRGIDFNLLVIFIGLFVIIGGVEHSGLLMLLMHTPWMKSVQNLQVFSILTVVLSNIVSNVPAVMLLKYLVPVHMGHVWWAALAIFSTVAGNLTLTGSIANLIVVELAKKENVEIKFLTYLKIGLPLTVSMVFIALLYFAIITKIFHIA